MTGEKKKDPAIRAYNGDSRRALGNRGGGSLRTGGMGQMEGGNSRGRQARHRPSLGGRSMQRTTSTKLTGGLESEKRKRPDGKVLLAAKPGKRKNGSIWGRPVVGKRVAPAPIQVTKGGLQRGRGERIHWSMIRGDRRGGRKQEKSGNQQ